MKKIYRVVLAFLFVFVLIAGTAVANDASMGRMGETVYPLEETDVTMVSEDIFIKFNTRGASNVSCEFVFENKGGAKTVLMGFPASKEIEYEGLTTEERVSLHNFTAFRNGVEIPVSEVPGSDMEGDFAKYPAWFVFEVPFGSGETLTMTHTYDVHFTHYSEGSINIGYILKTGSTWNGNIKHSKVTFDLTQIVPWGIEMYEQYSVNDFIYKDGMLIFEKRDFKPGYDIDFLTNGRYYSDYSGPWEPSDMAKERMTMMQNASELTDEELIEAVANLSYSNKFFEQIWLRGILESREENPNTSYAVDFTSLGLLLLVIGLLSIFIKQSYKNNRSF
ncbi:MAG: hypothetical protein R3232_05475 [Clostridia bacterium]|nr:hypothetical protein [Clostridia bacterium]